MSFAFMPLYTGDYLRDTAHLDCCEHGIYLLLLMYCWDQKAPIPLDERKQLGISRARSGSEIEALRRVLAEFFVKMTDGWYNTRMAEEVATAERISSQNRAAGLKSAEIRRVLREVKGNARSARVERSLEPPPPPPHSQPPLTLESTTPSGKPDAVAILDFLNAKAGRTFKPVRANLELIEARLKEGATPAECRAVVAKKCRDWKGSDMAVYLRPATLFNRTKFAQYQGELHAVS